MIRNILCLILGAIIYATLLAPRAKSLPKPVIATCAELQDYLQDATMNMLQYQLDNNFLITEDYYISMSYAETLKRNLDCRVDP